MSAEYVPRHGKADVAFAGTELKDAWLLIGSVFGGMALGSVCGWVAYLGLPALGYLGTKAYIDWKSRHLSGYVAQLSYRCGLGGYSTAFNRKNKRFIGDARVINPGALRMGATARADACDGIVADVSADSADIDGPPVEHGISRLAD